MKTAAAVAIAVTTGCMSPVIPFGAGKSPTEAQHESMDRLMPPVLDVDGAWPGEISIAKIRVWADDDYRAQNMHWQHAFEEPLEYANAVLGPHFGVRLQAEYHEWERHAPGGTLTDDLEALAQEDPGDGVFAVVGLTSSLGLVTATFDQIGLAQLPGRYLMLRGYADVQEHEAFARYFHDLRADERDSLFAARRLHQVTATLLHELGHNLGAPHEPTADTIMNPTYSNKAMSFSDQAHAVMLATLDGRLGRKRITKVATAPQVHHGSVVIAIGPAGETIVEGRPIDDAALDELLRGAYAQDHETEVVVSAGKGTPHDAVIKLLDRAKTIGLHRLSLGSGS